MNVNDVDEGVVPMEGDYLELIFARQRELMEKYHDIEKDSGLMQTTDCPVNLNDKRGQARLKDFAWRVTEELAEAYEARNKGHEEHCREELGDALHFFVELCILSGITAKELSPVSENKDRLTGAFEQFKQSIVPPSVALSTVVLHLGVAMNCLKNKPWKATQMMTDEAYYKENIRRTFFAFVDLCYQVQMDAETLFNYYFRKSEVNKFRIRSKY